MARLIADVRPGDLITAETMNRLFAIVDALDGRVGRLETSGVIVGEGGPQPAAGDPFTVKLASVVSGYVEGNTAVIKFAPYIGINSIVEYSVGFRDPAHYEVTALSVSEVNFAGLKINFLAAHLLGTEIDTTQANQIVPVRFVMDGSPSSIMTTLLLSAYTQLVFSMSFRIQKQSDHNIYIDVTQPLKFTLAAL